jgi:hypothetical protein
MKTLFKLNSSQKKMRDYVQRQNKGFDRLCEDIQSERLKMGLSQNQVISLYGDPILEKELENKTRWLYRYPVEYFHSDKAYLYFDRDNTLVGWELKEKEEKVKEEE